MLKLTTTAQLESPRSFCQAVRKLERLVARNIEILKFLYHWPKSSNFCSMQLGERNFVSSKSNEKEARKAYNTERGIYSPYLSVNIDFKNISIIGKSSHFCFMPLN